MDEEHAAPKDPLGLEAVDRAISNNERAERAKELAERGATPFDPGDSDGPFDPDDEASEEHQEFLRQMDIIENGPYTTHFEMLRRAGVTMPPPEELDDPSLTAKLWEVIEALAAISVFLSHTDHLSDRQLYHELWSDLLREATADLPPHSGWNCHIDVIGSGSEEDIELGLRYYDTEEDRQHWAQEFPNDTIPPHEDPPYDRDRRLPRPPEEAWRHEDEDGEDDGDEE